MHRIQPRHAGPVAPALGSLVIVAACGGGATPTGPVTRVATPAAASASVAPASSAPAIVLSETWTAPVDGRTVSHPAG